MAPSTRPAVVRRLSLVSRLPVLYGRMRHRSSDSAMSNTLADREEGSEADEARCAMRAAALRQVLRATGEPGPGQSSRQPHQAAVQENALDRHQVTLSARSTWMLQTAVAFGSRARTGTGPRERMSRSSYLSGLWMKGSSTVCTCSAFGGMASQRQTTLGSPPRASSSLK